MNVKGKKVKSENWSLISMLLIPLAAHCLLLTVSAQSGGNYAITQSVIAGGGQNSTGGNYSVAGTVGQTVAGQATSGGIYNVNAGFWLPQQLAPTAATVSVSGRALTADGQGIRNVRVSLTDSSGTIRWAQTTSFGYYRFDEIQVGQTCVLQIFSKRFVFADPVRVLNVREAIADADFTAEAQ